MSNKTFYGVIIGYGLGAGLILNSLFSSCASKARADIQRTDDKPSQLEATVESNIDPLQILNEEEVARIPKNYGDALRQLFAGNGIDVDPSQVVWHSEENLTARLQEGLNALGYDIAVDRQYERSTERAVEDLQRKNQIFPALGLFAKTNNGRILYLANTTQ